MCRLLSWLFVLTAFASCDFLDSKEGRKNPLARVNQSYLYFEDIRDLLGPKMSSSDSILLIENQINKWATQQLLIDQANINLDIQVQSSLEDLIQQYRTDLYTESYKSKIVSSQLDSMIDFKEMQAYYLINNENFRLNEALVRCRYIYLNKDFLAIDQVKEALKRYDSSDRKLLEAWRLQFKSANLNDSIWIRQERLKTQIPPLEEKDIKSLKNLKINQFQDSLGLYLLKIEAVLERNDIAPLAYVLPTIRQIILNRRKRELTLELEKDITKDAIRNKTFEIYEQ